MEPKRYEIRSGALAEIPRDGQTTVIVMQAAAYDALARELATYKQNDARRMEICNALQAELDTLRAQLRASREDARARSMFDRTAAAKGFVNAPQWDELAEETRQTYRDRVAALQSTPQLAKNEGEKPSTTAHIQS